VLDETAQPPAADADAVERSAEEAEAFELLEDAEFPPAFALEEEEGVEGAPAADAVAELPAPDPAHNASINVPA